MVLGVNVSQVVAVISVNFSYPSLEEPKPVSEEPASAQLNGRTVDPESAPEPPAYTPVPLAQPAKPDAATPPTASPRHTPQVSYTWSRAPMIHTNAR